MSRSILVLGGGVIGLSSAFALRARGFDVTVLEQGICGGQASGAAAGMLAPFSENVEQPDPFFELCLASLHLYPDWQQQIKEIAGAAYDFEYAPTGSLYVCWHEADKLAMESRMQWQQRYGARAELLSAEQLREREPAISPDAIAALHYPTEAHVYAPGYVRALEQACRRTGVHIRDQLGAVELVQWETYAELTSAAGERFTADQLVICTGAWAGLLADTFGFPIPVYPIRGQICAYADTPAVHHMVFCSQGYLVAKQNGSLVCGASEDIAGFETSVTARGIDRLEKWNKQLFPFLEPLTPFHKWAGLRPATQDGFPLLGRLHPGSAAIVAAGHYRNGILLSPVTAHLVADIAEQRTNTAVPLAPFAPTRF